MIFRVLYENHGPLGLVGVLETKKSEIDEKQWFLEPLKVVVFDS